MKILKICLVIVGIVLLSLIGYYVHDIYFTPNEHGFYPNLSTSEVDNWTTNNTEILTYDGTYSYFEGDNKVYVYYMNGTFKESQNITEQTLPLKKCTGFWYIIEDDYEYQYYSNGTFIKKSEEWECFE